MRPIHIFNNLIRVCCFVCCMALQTQAQYRVELLDTSTFKRDPNINLSKISFRGLSVVDDKTIWVSGSRGTVARSTDGGLTFQLQQLNGYEKSDFRDIEAFDDNNAVLMSSGTPALILKTSDGGQNWKEVYRNNDSAYFLDAMDFWDKKRGVILGDPIHHHFVVLQTKDGGRTWTEMDKSKTPHAAKHEAVFAASGTSLRCVGDYGKMGFVTGGSCSRLITSNISKKGFVWDAYLLKIMQGAASQGAFSFAFNDSALIAVGGDYAEDTKVDLNSSVMYLPAKLEEVDFAVLEDDVNGYRSCIEPINGSQFISCGTSGVDVYENRTWKNISTEAFHVVKKAKNGKAIFFAGPKGKIGKLK